MTRDLPFPKPSGVNLVSETETDTLATPVLKGPKVPKRGSNK